MEVRRGDRIKTAKEARCEIKLNDGSVIRIGENSDFDFQQSNLSKSTRQVEAGLSFGKIWAVVTKWANPKDQFTVKSPTAVCAVRGTIYRMEADSTTRVAVYDGQVDVGPTDDLRRQLQQQQRPLGPPQRIPGPTQVPGPYQVSLEQWERLVQGYQIEVRNNGRYAKTQIDSTAEAQVDWIRWNQERDRLLR
jgi:ferric-dicitrate binding protein FerR (iron transport regulator)